MRCITIVIVTFAVLLLTGSARVIGPAILETTPGGTGQSTCFDQACALAGVDPLAVGIDQGDIQLWGGGKYAPPLLKTFMDNPWKISPYTRVMTDQLLQSAATPATVLMAMHGRTGHGVRMGLTGDPLEPYLKRVAELGSENLAVALSELTGEPAESFKLRNGEYEALPAAVRDSAALFCFALPGILEYRKQALEDPMLRLGLNPQAVYEEVLRRTALSTEDDDLSTEMKYSLMVEQLLDNVDFELLNAGAVLTALVAQKMRELLVAQQASLAALDFGYGVSTKWGCIDLAGGSYLMSDEPALLVIETGAGNRYKPVGCNRSYAQPVSVCVDLGGDDIYSGVNPERDPLLGGSGAGIMGYAVIIDIAGHDIYAADYAGTGCGILGSGVVIDEAGDDQYRCSGSCGQGCGVYGTGVLIDLAGSDKYEIQAFGQGYGGTLGAGLLLDAAGDDTYTGAEEPGKENGGPFGAQHFIHFTQGAAYGRRADYTDGHSWAGGVGLLLDGAGNDAYSCDVYGQGTGYWYGLGMCVDKGGDDTHRAGWYSLGGSPHFACGVFQDDGGDDRYICRVMQSLGNARDFSVAWFEDSAGDDYYQGGIMTLGVGDINGLGFFWDKAGDDTYIAKGPCLGQSRIETGGTLRDIMLTLGLFIDGGGADRYLTLPGAITPSGEWTAEITAPESLPALDFCGDTRQWSRPADQNPAINAIGAGLDKP